MSIVPDLIDILNEKSEVENTSYVPSELVVVLPGSLIDQKETRKILKTQCRSEGIENKAHWEEEEEEEVLQVWRKHEDEEDVNENLWDENQSRKISEVTVIKMSKTADSSMEKSENESESYVTCELVGFSPGDTDDQNEILRILPTEYGKEESGNLNHGDDSQKEILQLTDENSDFSDDNFKGTMQMWESEYENDNFWNDSQTEKVALNATLKTSVETGSVTKVGEESENKEKSDVPHETVGFSPNHSDNQEKILPTEWENDIGDKNCFWDDSTVDYFDYYESSKSFSQPPAVFEETCMLQTHVQKPCSPCTTDINLSGSLSHTKSLNGETYTVSWCYMGVVKLSWTTLGYYVSAWDAFYDGTSGHLPTADDLCIERTFKKRCKSRNMFIRNLFRRRRCIAGFKLSDTVVDVPTKMYNENLFNCNQFVATSTVCTSIISQVEVTWTTLGFCVNAWDAIPSFAPMCPMLLPPAFYKPVDVARGNSSFYHITSKHNDENQFKCGLCAAKFKTKGYLNLHMKVHNDNRPFKCQICSKAFKRKGSFKIHLAAHRNEKWFKCEVCPANFKFKAALIRHTKEHHKKTPYKCAICPKSFRSVLRLNLHNKLHDNGRSFCCDICLAKFEHNRSLIGHKKMHTHITPFECELCPAKFKYKGNLTSHMKIHSDVKEHVCYHCSEAFRRKSEVNVHILRMHSRPFICHLCSATFKSKRHLKQHTQLHSNIRPVQSKPCPASHKVLQSLRIQKITHPNITHIEKCANPTNLRSHSVAHDDDEEDDNLFSCYHCSGKFIEKVALKRHITRPLDDRYDVHLGERSAKVASIKLVKAARPHISSLLEIFLERAGRMLKDT